MTAGPMTKGATSAIVYRPGHEAAGPTIVLAPRRATHRDCPNG